MTTYTIYGDLLFLANFFMDFTLLYGVSRFGNFKTPFRYLLLSSVFAAAYGVLAVMPDFSFCGSFGWKLFASVLIVKLAFPHIALKQYGKALLYFYLLSFAMGGAVMAISWLAVGEQWQGQELSYTALALGGGVLVILLLSRWSMGYIKETLRKNEQVQKIEVVLGDNKVGINALLDTGNELVDPITRCPVLVAEFAAMAPLLPLSFRDAWLRNPEKEVTSLMADFIDTPMGRRLRLIPFSSIGKKNGMMLGIQPDYIIVKDKKEMVLPLSVVCLYRGTLHTKDQCRCIMNPAALGEMKIHACSGRPLGLGQ